MLLFDDPVSCIVDRLDLEVTHAICVPRSSVAVITRTFGSMQHSNGHIDAAVCVSAMKPLHCRSWSVP